MKRRAPSWADAARSFPAQELEGAFVSLPSKVGATPLAALVTRLVRPAASKHWRESP